jgi:hypothetical protein
VAAVAVWSAAALSVVALLVATDFYYFVVGDALNPPHIDDLHHRGSWSLISAFVHAGAVGSSCYQAYWDAVDLMSTSLSYWR